MNATVEYIPSPAENHRIDFGKIEVILNQGLKSEPWMAMQIVGIRVSFHFRFFRKRWHYEGESPIIFWPGSRWVHHVLRLTGNA